MSTRPQGTFARTALAGALLAAAIGTGGASIAVAQDASAAPDASAAAEGSLTFGMILVGPAGRPRLEPGPPRGGRVRRGEAGRDDAPARPGQHRPIVPELTVDQAARDMIDQGAQLVFMTSDDMKDGALLAAEQNPDVPMIWSSGDNAWADGMDHRPELANLGNVMGQMEYRQGDRGLQRGPGDADRQHRLRRSAHQRRDAAPRELRLPGRAPLLGELPRQRPRRPDVRGQLDRLLVQHPGRHARPHAGQQRLHRRRRGRPHAAASTRPRR